MAEDSIAKKSVLLVCKIPTTVIWSNVSSENELLLFTNNEMKLFPLGLSDGPRRPKIYTFRFYFHT